MSTSNETRYVTPEERFHLYRLCQCTTCGGKGKWTQTPPGRYEMVRCEVCRGEGRTRTDGSRQIVAAHRVSYWLEHGIWSTREQHLHHRCENPSCVRPSHLELLAPGEHIYRHDGPTAQNGRLTHCRKCGRELADENLMRGRRCRHCRNAYMREFRQAQRRTLKAQETK